MHWRSNKVLSYFAENSGAYCVNQTGEQFDVTVKISQQSRVWYEGYKNVKLIQEWECRCAFIEKL